MRKSLWLIFPVIMLSACTSVQVSPVNPDLPFLHVCIKENKRVRVSDFLPVLAAGLDRHGVTSEVFSGKKPAHCEFILEYTARRSWDFKPYLKHAELRITQNRRQIAAATYHHDGGLSLMKWQSTQEKMDPVIDQLFAPPGVAQ